MFKSQFVLITVHPNSTDTACSLVLIPHKMRVLTPYPQNSVETTLSLILEPSAETAHPGLVLTPHIDQMLNRISRPSADTAHRTKC